MLNRTKESYFLNNIECFKGFLDLWINDIHHNNDNNNKKQQLTS